MMLHDERNVQAGESKVHYLSPTKVARFWASLQMGHGDYLAWRDQNFADTTVDELYEQIVEFQQQLEP